MANTHLSALGELSANLAHEINGPLQIISSASRQVRRNLPELNESQEDSLALIQSIIKRISRIISNLQRLSHKDSEELASISLTPFLEGLNDFIEVKAEGSLVKVEQSYTTKETFSIMASEVALSQIVVNLVNNAIDALNETDLGEKVITIDTFENSHRRGIEISDNEPGIPEENVAKIFSPLFTSKAVGKGTGLGLSLSSKLAQSMNAHLELIQDGKTRFRIVFDK